MECLSRLLLSRYEADTIRYHPGTEQLKISHLMFADDVIVFFDGSSNSLHGISECLDDFASWSGLQMNTSKTELFTSSLDQSESAAISSYGFTSGQLPISYLGLPLMSRKLKLSEYAPLLTKITARFQNIEKKGIAKIAWQTSPSLWVEWHWNPHLNERSFWAIEPRATYSWAWRKLLDLRPLALQFCKTKLGNGRSTSFWFDVWTPLGQLIDYIGPAGPRALRIRENVLVSDAITENIWSLPHPRSQREVELHMFLTTVNLPLPLNVVDKVEWLAADFLSRIFRSSTTWEVLRPREEVKDWVDIVWFKGGIPKLAFTMWIANYNRLPTRSRLAAWGLPISSDCPFCSRYEETRDHLMLSCPYSTAVWQEVLRRCHPPSSMFTSWSELLSWVRSSPSKKLTLLRKLAVQAVIFNIWK
ncbi:uncharacterized protein LOC108835601 [Raphanus sativus]|uniref:Uncharacterized protein LOC108835601 n=1 Tax=Raphanus sativus TaxID=3726 RepID=A0A6J0LVX6_RAPSA|nr:uncharacterized protein LOC108835601 [Raphanus sativus]